MRTFMGRIRSLRRKIIVFFGSRLKPCFEKRENRQEQIGRFDRRNAWFVEDLINSVDK